MSVTLLSVHKGLWTESENEGDIWTKYQTNVYTYLLYSKMFGAPLEIMSLINLLDSLESQVKSCKFEELF